MLFRPDGGARCAVVTIAHLSDEERQFVTTLVLSKLVTWMRQQSGTTDLRAMLYMDEVAGYLPPTANPPTKQPIMTLMKQARAFGLGVVLSTQNPVDIDYKAISNAGTWMIGRLQTDRDKAAAARRDDERVAGGVDVAAIDATISGLASGSSCCAVPGKDTPEVFTTRWAMSYLRGPMTRDQIAAITRPIANPLHRRNRRRRRPSGEPPPARTPRPRTATPTADEAPTVMPAVAPGIAVRYVDLAAPWLADGRRQPDRHDPLGGDRRPGRVALRRDESRPRPRRRVRGRAVPARRTARRDGPDAGRLRRPRPPGGAARRRRPTSCPARAVDTKTFWTAVERDIRDHLVRTLALDLPTNPDLKLYGRPGETADAVRDPVP